MSFCEFAQLCKQFFLSHYEKNHVIKLPTVHFMIQNHSVTLNLLYYLSYITACSVIPVMGKNCFIINGCLTSSSASKGSNCFIQKSSNLQLEDGIRMIEIYLKTCILKKKRLQSSKVMESKPSCYPLITQDFYNTMHNLNTF